MPNSRPRRTPANERITMDNENPITDAIDETEVQDGGEAGNEDRQEQAETEGGAAESAEEPGDGDRGRKQTHELNAAAKAARKQAERETDSKNVLKIYLKDIVNF